MNADVTVLVTSCDAYHDVEAPFLRLFQFRLKQNQPDLLQSNKTSCR